MPRIGQPIALISGIVSPSASTRIMPLRGRLGGEIFFGVVGLGDVPLPPRNRSVPPRDPENPVEGLAPVGYYWGKSTTGEIGSHGGGIVAPAVPARSRGDHARRAAPGAVPLAARRGGRGGGL